MATTTKQIDKSSWGPGPWQEEPDHVEFRAHGFPCILHRQPTRGHWCGYVGVPPGHPWHRKSYAGGCDENGTYIPSGIDVDVHGGLTYAEKCAGAICHIPAPGESDDVWWLGFDCAHSGDLSPGGVVRDAMLGLDWSSGNEIYARESYVRRQTEGLARQAAEAATP